MDSELPTPLLYVYLCRLIVLFDSSHACALVVIGALLWYATRLRAAIGVTIMSNYILLQNLTTIDQS